MSISRNHMNLLKIAFLTALLLSACSVSKRSSGHESDTGDQSTQPRILFLNYEVEVDPTTSNRSARLINMTISNGSIKEGSRPSREPVPNDLVITLLDEENQVMHLEYIPDPLNRSVEFVDNDGNLGFKTIQSDRAQFFVRLQLEKDATSVMIEQFTAKDHQNVPLLTNQIQ